MTVRPVDFRDIKLLSEFWYDTMALRSQKQSVIRLMPDAIEQWQEYATRLCHDEQAVFLLVEIEGDILGCIVGWVEDNQPGLLPRQYGIVEQLILDLHSPHKRKNAVNELLEAFKLHFRQKRYFAHNGSCTRPFTCRTGILAWSQFDTFRRHFLDGFIKL